jgi:hypothetical protein
MPSVDQISGVSDGTLSKSVMQIIGEFSADQKGDPVSIGAMPNVDNVDKFTAALGVDSGAQGGFRVAEGNLNSAYVNLNTGANAGNANAVDVSRGINDLKRDIPRVESNLSKVSQEAVGEDYENKLSHFVSAVRKKLQETTEIVKKLSQKSDLSQQDLMEIQFHVMEMSIVLDVASKVGDKGSQALQTLFRDK